MRGGRGSPGQAAPENALYVHLADDGAIFVVRGDGTQAWITRGALDGELRALAESAGTLLYSRDDPAEDPPQIVFETFRGLADLGVPIKLLDRPHPDTAPPPGGATRLMVFAYSGTADLVDDLLRRGADAEARDEDGYTALSYAANRGQDECARVLLAHSADPDAADHQNNTPLMFAAQHGHMAVVERLLAAGADPNLRGDHGLTALGLARQNGHLATAARLVAAGGHA